MIAVANVVVSALLLLWGKQVAKAAFLPGHLLVPGVMMFLFMGTWIESPSMGAWVTLMFMGALGFIMKVSGWPRPPIILAMILGNYLENYFQLSVGTHDGYGWLGRPIVLVIMALIVLTLLFSTRSMLKEKKAALQSSIKEEGTKKGRPKRKGLKVPVISFPFAIALCIVLVWAGFESLQWPMAVRIFPLLVIIPAIALLLPILYNDMRDLLAELKVEGSMTVIFRKTWEKTLLTKAFQYYFYLIAVFLLTLALGQKIVLPVFICVYLFRWGKFGRRTSVGFALAGWVVLIGFYDQTMHLFWHQSWLSSWLPSVLPDWIPAWLII
jgi:putative tricarboxylic transport membrane protein